jgi:hypothetical protein
MRKQYYFTMDEAIAQAKVRSNKRRRDYSVVSFTSDKRVRYRVYEDGQMHRALPDTEIGESPKCVGYWRYRFAGWLEA